MFLSPMLPNPVRFPASALPTLSVRLPRAIPAMAPRMRPVTWFGKFDRFDRLDRLDVLLFLHLFYQIGADKTVELMLIERSVRKRTF
jgi:hypothetical protein